MFQSAYLSLCCCLYYIHEWLMIILECTCILGCAFLCVRMLLYFNAYSDLSECTSQCIYEHVCMYVFPINIWIMCWQVFSCLSTTGAITRRTRLLLVSILGVRDRPVSWQQCICGECSRNTNFEWACGNWHRGPAI